ncbi:neurogenic locus notch homolog protein 1-like [Mizuhopecten yessoensis]|uniref:neurogenic locus notch homolog protein 1-like n=1 Tax=Mizuhopecten yessoensis TaxID=6573 RepID=UPI000B45D586|nr:neurogenic locus notch homolog protein 1-like [Mizuhopecten yessoensis]
MQAWCNSGYTGPGCKFHYTGTSPYVSCQHGHLGLQCSNEEPVIVRYTSYTSASIRSIQTFQRYIAAFLKQHVCDTMQLYEKRSLWSYSRLGFTAKCGNRSVEPIVIQAALATEGYGNTGSLKFVPTTLNNYHTGMAVAAIFAVKIQTYANTDRSSETPGTPVRKCCDGGSLPHCDTDTCDTHFRICVNNDSHNAGTGSCINTNIRPDTNQLASCGDLRVNQATNQLDFASTYISVTDTWTWNNTYIHVEARDADDGDKYDVIDTLTLKKDLTPGYWDLSNAASVSVLLQGHVRLSLRLLVRCGANRYGKNCDVQCTASGHRSCDPDTGATICQSGYTGSDCHDIDECKEHYCHGPGTLHCTNRRGSYQCGCNTGWTGKNCSQDVDECQHHPCQHGGTCNNTVGSYICTCHGFHGQNCERDIDECQPNNPCQHGGTCHNTRGSYTCSCHGFTGQNCSQDVDKCQQNPCQHGGTCNNTVGSYTCSCHGFSGQNCENDINECTNVTCPHKNAHCVNNIGSYTCQCNTGWAGSQCNTDVDECKHNPCKHGGTCHNTPGSYTCQCNTGWTGSQCNTDVDECKHNPCKHGGTCHNTDGNFTCQCNTAWTGWSCSEDVNECHTIHNLCQNGGTCTNNPGRYKCTCKTGWKGVNCSTDINECDEHVCKHNATCTNTGGGFNCTCKEGWQGNTCERDKDECRNSPCHNGATCQNNAGSYRCVCRSGWSGHHCDVDRDECKLTKMCHHGSCLNTNGSYVCNCDSGWGGQNCTDDTNECLTSQPCLNNGQCINTPGSYQCSCTTHWAGQHCSQDVDECKLPNRCNGSDVCINYPGGFMCSHHTESSTTSQDKNSNSEYSPESYMSVISLECSANAWKVRIYLPELYKRHIDFDPTDIYLGEAGCQGYRSGDYLVIYQQYNDCRTHHSITTGSDVYANILVYAIRDANYKFIIRDYRFRIDLECNMAKHETISQHFIETQNRVHTRNNNPQTSGYGHYSISMTFYRDSNYLQHMSDNSIMADNPLSADIGKDIYVKLTTSVTETDVKMRVESCYTLPSPGAGDHLKFYLIRNACAIDVNTRVLYMSSHETRLVFRDFVYATDQGNLYLYCTATFCNTTDFSSMCDQQCRHRSRRSVLTASGTYLYKATTSGVVHRPIGLRRSMVGKPDVEEASGHAQDTSFNSIIFVAALLIGVVVLSCSVVIRVTRGRLQLDPGQ